MRFEKIKKIIFHPLFVVGTIILCLRIFDITRYDFIADKDSYGWLIKYTPIQDNSLYFYRQLFSAFIFSLQHLTGLSMFNVFKYLLPILSVATLLPVWLVARKLNEKKFQIMVLLATVVSPTVIIQFEGTRPQVMAMFYLYFMLGLSITAFEKKNYAWLYGIFIPVTAVSSLFHRVFVLFLALWVISAAYTYRKIIYKNKIKVVILLGLLYPWLDKLEARAMTIVIFKSFYDIFQKIFLHFETNFRFPAFYVNVDGKQLGWGSLAGVAKYYAFYVGPFLGILIIFGLYFFIKSKKARESIKNNLNIEYFLPIYLFIAFFLFIAEVLPRFGNIAYLPDRAWIFLGILLIFPLFRLFAAIEKNNSAMKKNIIFSIFLIGFAISVSGAVYMKNRFKYIVPQYEMDSFKWIKNNLEPNRVIFYYGWGSVLRYHSETPVIGIKKDLISRKNLPLLIKTLEFKDVNGVDNEELKMEISDIGTSFSELQNTAKYNFDRKILLDNLKQVRSKTSTLFSDLSVNPDLINNVAYIYYAKDSVNNPYRDRMWETGYSTDVSADVFLVLDKNPNYFQKVYDTGNVMIWKYAPNEN